MTEILAFLAGSAVLIWLSRKPLRQPGSHGFYRFFAWECILVLVVRNLAIWGDDPLAPHQLLSWSLLIASIALVVAGIRTLQANGRAQGKRDDASLYEWEKTEALVTHGIFAWIRHPMYASLLALTWGAYFKDPGLGGLPFALIGSACLLTTALADEKECLAHFGQPYTDYMQRSKRFIPGLF